MEQRVLVSKTFNSGVVIQALIYRGMPLSKGIIRKYGGTKEDTDVFFLSNVPEEISLNCDIKSAREFFESNEQLSALVISDGDCGFKTLSEQCKQGQLQELLESGQNYTLRKQLNKLCISLFGKTNPKTNGRDISNDVYAPYIPFAVVSGALPPQLDAYCNTYFNPQGQVLVSRALDSLNALKYGYASNLCRKDSLDRVSGVEDFFNEGYNKCLDSVASPFFSLFTRSELLTPLTLAELAYIIVVCFKDFRDVYGSVSGFSGNGNPVMGISLDWERPKKIIKEYRSKYSDMTDYIVTRCSVDTYTGEGDVKSVLDISIKSYMSGRTMTDFRRDLLSGKSAIPLPYLMSILELNKLGIIQLDGIELAPLKEVSRGEFARILVCLASKLYS